MSLSSCVVAPKSAPTIMIIPYDLFRVTFAFAVNGWGDAECV